MRLHECKLVYRESKGRRTTLRFHGNTIEVCVPKRADMRRVQAWIASLEPRLERRLSATPFHLVCIPYGMEEGSSARILDRDYRIIPLEAKRSSVRLENEYIHLSGSTPAHRQKAFARFCGKELLREVESRCTSLSEHIGCSIEGITVRSYRTRLGSCASDGILAFHWGLVFLPAAHRHAVMAHEVAHLKERNHGSAFWKLVEELSPGARALHKDIRKLGPFLHL